MKYFKSGVENNFFCSSDKTFNQSFNKLLNKYNSYYLRAFTVQSNVPQRPLILFVLRTRMSEMYHIMTTTLRCFYGLLFFDHLKWWNLVFGCQFSSTCKLECFLESCRNSLGRFFFLSTSRRVVYRIALLLFVISEIHRWITPIEICRLLVSLLKCSS